MGNGGTLGELRKRYPKGRDGAKAPQYSGGQGGGERRNGGRDQGFALGGAPRAINLNESHPHSASQQAPAPKVHRASRILVSHHATPAATKSSLLRTTRIMVQTKPLAPEMRAFRPLYSIAAAMSRAVVAITK